MRAAYGVDFLPRLYAWRSRKSDRSEPLVFFGGSDLDRQGAPEVDHAINALVA